MQPSKILRPKYMQNMLKRMEVKPIETFAEFSNTFSGFEESVTSKRGVFIALCVAFYYKISKSNADRQSFLKNVFFAGKPVEFLEGRLLLSVFRFALRAPTGGAMYDRARVYAIGMEEAVADEVDPLDIPELIKKAGGIDQLSKDVKERKTELENKVTPPVSGSSQARAQAQTSHNNPNDWIVGEEQEGANTDRTDKGKDNGKGAVTTSGTAGRPPRPKKEEIPFDPRSDLIINFLVADELCALLDSEATKGEISFNVTREEGKPPTFVKVFCTYK